MNNQFERFTERARKVLALAQEEAQRFNHNYIGTEHLLLGLVREGDGVAAKVLNNLGVELNKVRSAVEFIIGRGDRIVLGEIGLTPRSKKVIELAVDEARRLNHHYIGTEHLLLGLVREGEGIAAGVLESLGVNLEKVRSQSIQVLQQSGGHTEQREGTQSEPLAVASPLPSAPDTAQAGPVASLVGVQARRVQDVLARMRLVVWLGIALLALSIAHLLEDFAYGIPARFGLSIATAALLVGAAYAVQMLGLLLAMRLRRAGFILTLLTGLGWALAIALDHGGEILSSNPYRAGLVSKGIEVAVLAAGLALAGASLWALPVAPRRPIGGWFSSAC